MLLVAGIATVLLVLIEPHLRRVAARVVVFAAYIAGAAVFSAYTVSYWRDSDVEPWITTGCALLLGTAIIYMLFSVWYGGAPPAPPQRRYRSLTRRTLNAVKVFKPAEHWRVPNVQKEGEQ